VKKKKGWKSEKKRTNLVGKKCAHKGANRECKAGGGGRNGFSKKRGKTKNQANTHSSERDEKSLDEEKIKLTK